MSLGDVHCTTQYIPPLGSVRIQYIPPLGSVRIQSKLTKSHTVLHEDDQKQLHFTFALFLYFDVFISLEIEPFRKCRTEEGLTFENLVASGRAAPSPY